MKSLFLEDLSIGRIEGFSKLKELRQLLIILDENPGKLSKLEGLENLINLEEIEIDVFNIVVDDVPIKEYVIFYRFPCLVKSKNYKSIEDWQDIFKNFPTAFRKLKRGMSDEKIEWYIEQCSDNLSYVINKILIDPEYKYIKEGQEKEWKEIYNNAKQIFSKKGPKKNILALVKKEVRKRKF